MRLADLRGTWSCCHETGQPLNLLSKEERGTFRANTVSITQRGRTSHISQRGHILDRVSFQSREVERRSFL